jgi:hypothetical protein
MNQKTNGGFGPSLVFVNARHKITPLRKPIGLTGRDRGRFVDPI